MTGKKIHRRKKNKQKYKIGFDVISNLDDESDLAELAIFSWAFVFTLTAVGLFSTASLGLFEPDFMSVRASLFRNNEKTK